ncbi:hypothetical protein FOL47_003767 [Perkinsus chesapeaki]|uniref:Peptidase M12A domain-containing protein n=1 Tax=Perkinsus chesapeaki TaxID=330153 RepID=A0A7J6N069_PERCH|nr:hypothetical protein FOL47_003767 [Perkinsus chesapeaki]
MPMSISTMLNELEPLTTGNSTSSSRSKGQQSYLHESIFEVDSRPPQRHESSTFNWSSCGGLLLITTSFWLLAWNETVNSPLEASLVYAFHHARNASCDFVDEANTGDLVWLSCPVISMPMLAELAPSDIQSALSQAGLEARGTQLEWTVEMLQWTEEEVCRGSTRRSECLYTYSKEFTHVDIDPTHFYCATKIRTGCSTLAPSERPPVRLAQLGRPETLHGIVKAPEDSVVIGNPRNGYVLNSALADQISGKAQVQLIDREGAAALLGADRDLYVDFTLNESFAQTYVASPRIGDLRLRVSVSSADFVSLVAKQELSGHLGPYSIPGLRRSLPVEWLIDGRHADLHSLLKHHSKADFAWFWRFMGILFLWLGAALLLSPLGETEPACMAVLCVACFAGAVLSALLAAVGIGLFASFPFELLVATLGVVGAGISWRAYKASWLDRAHYYQYYYGGLYDDASSPVAGEMPLIRAAASVTQEDPYWFERRLDNRCIESSDDEDDDEYQETGAAATAMAPRIVALDAATLKLPSDAWRSLSALGDLSLYEDTTTPEQAIDRAKDADILLINKVPLGPDVLGHLPSLKMISVMATGYDNIDIRSLKSGQIVSNVPDYSTNSTAQQTVALILEICNSVGMHNAAVHAGEWSKEGLFWFRKHEMLELGPEVTIGIVGLGTIGTRVYELLRPFGCQFLAWSPDTRKELPQLVYTDDVGELFQRSNLVTLHCKLTQQNYGFVNGPLLHRMQPGSILVNAARGALVNEQDLADALNCGHLAAAAVDVVSHEPINDTNPLLQAKNCIITPHMAWTAPEARQRCLAIATSNVEAFLSGNPSNVVASGQQATASTAALFLAFTLIEHILGNSLKGSLSQAAMGKETPSAADASQGTFHETEMARLIDIDNTRPMKFLTTEKLRDGYKGHTLSEVSPGSPPTNRFGDMIVPDTLLEGANPAWEVWPHPPGQSSEILYEFDHSAKACVRSVIMEAIKHVSVAAPCITFIDAEHHDQPVGAHTLKIKGEDSGCYASLGYSNTHENVLNLGRGCMNVGTAIHLLMHVLGVAHENQRPDSEAYMETIPSHIENGVLQNEEAMKVNFQIFQGTGTEWERAVRGIAYDVASVTHGGPCYYSASRFERDGCSKTLVPRADLGRTASEVMGNRAFLTAHDIALLRIMYGCGGHYRSGEAYVAAASNTVYDISGKALLEPVSVLQQCLFTDQESFADWGAEGDLEPLQRSTVPVEQHTETTAAPSNGNLRTGYETIMMGVLVVVVISLVVFAAYVTKDRWFPKVEKTKESIKRITHRSREEQDEPLVSEEDDRYDE